MAWTRFMDMHSGGGTKVKPYEYIYIEASEDEARRVFYTRFKRDPENTTCSCCGEDYSIREYETLEEATAYERHLIYAELPRPEGMDKATKAAVEIRSKYYEENKKVARYLEPHEKMPKGLVDHYQNYSPPMHRPQRPITLQKYLKDKTILVIRAKEIKPEEKATKILTRRQVWVEEYE